MIDSKLLLADLKKQLKLLESDLRSEAKRPTGEESERWAKELREEHQHARDHDRTARTFDDWLEGEVSQAAVAWIVASVFIRFCEDNALLNDLWIAGPADRTQRASEAEMAHYAKLPTDNARDWLKTAFGALADLPAGRALVDRKHNLVWRAPISAESASALLKFWRQTDEDGVLRHDFTDPDYGTRFLGDLYQDLSDYAKKTFALLQTPDFIEEFILDQTLTPAIQEFGIAGLKLIDPTCGSGHFLLGAFERLHCEWEADSPGLSRRQRVQNALDSIHGVDLNPFAVAIARFRLTVAALGACGESSLVTAPAFSYHLAVGDSLIGEQGRQGDLFEDGEDAYSYASEDIGDYKGILEPGTYHVVVGNPPYITVKDKALNEWYRQAYETCSGKYALSVPFMELFFRLAIRGSAGTTAGHVGQITSNSFMKREFGKKLIQDLLSGRTLSNPVDLTHIIDTSGAYIPGHGTPTVILVGRRRAPVASTVRAVLGVRGEPGQPKDPSNGLVWSEITKHLAEESFNGKFVTVASPSRETFAQHPWSLSGGGAAALKELLDMSAAETLGGVSDAIGIMAVLGEEEPFELPPASTEPSIDVVVGEDVRDFRCSGHARFWPYTEALNISDQAAGSKWMWPFRRSVSGYLMFGKTRQERGLSWFEYGMLAKPKLTNRFTIAFAFVATHNHFVLNRGGKIFNRTAPVIKLPTDATEEHHLGLLAILNSSTACFWLKQVCHDKGNGGVGGGIADQEWERFFEFTSTKLQGYPLPSHLPVERGRVLDNLASALDSTCPSTTVSKFVGDSSATKLNEALNRAREEWDSLLNRMIFAQEELDWDAYRTYGLVETDLTYKGTELDSLERGTRAFELVLAQRQEDGIEETAWFTRHDTRPQTSIPSGWPDDYKELVSRRLQAMRLVPEILHLERPEFKRRWATEPWDAQQQRALRELILDRLEDVTLWADAQGASCKSVAQLADAARHDAVLVAALQVLTGSSHVELVPALTSLLSDESVPYLAQLRYRESGLINYRGWQAVWDLQRREDSGEKVDIPVPPKYKPVDFQKTSYWQARGKLDVPKERFISYPGLLRSGDTTPVFGWAGWDHAAAALALARATAEFDAEGATPEQLKPMLAGLHELEPWVIQWHSEIDPAIGTSPAAAITGMLDGYLSRFALTRTDLNKWRPAASALRGRRRTSASVENTETFV
ncbi:BREX-2 system adenine-specific DNA-methyltransferase PglX [Pseudarthrobacter sp. B4EP4b]|uniref:BREX-2 system adenine-specific DNA-methyltransferase PglX n=1 Tax=Pseudarthrobacter sp. B4EP4b TaxID=2590664 RepID=UPI00114D6900|nr:BREX-2 system adenine-specific DNA-methyltransferase PglX [Pseudarthrobacter sp. B4EP4b]